MKTSEMQQVAMTTIGFCFRSLRATKKDFPKTFEGECRHFLGRISAYRQMGIIPRPLADRIQSLILSYLVYGELTRENNKEVMQ